VTATLIVLMVPPIACKPNWRGHWRTKAAATKELREASRLAAVDALNTAGTGVSAFCGYYGLVVIDIAIAWNGRRSGLDHDGAISSCKAIIDGISDALWDSRDAHVQVGRVTQTRGEGTVTVTFRGGS
jgi:hypothetical protein